MNNVKNLMARLGVFFSVLLAATLFPALASADVSDVHVCLPSKPALAASSAFDFIFDPSSLVENTSGARFGGNKTVEPGATLLFAHDSGGYDFTARSEPVVFINLGEEEVELTITASVSGMGDAILVQSGSFVGRRDASVYLALIGSGTSGSDTKPFPAGESIELSVTLGQFGSYMIQLTGGCNPYGKWGEIENVPNASVRVNWTLESLNATLFGVFDKSDDEDNGDMMAPKTLMMLSPPLRNEQDALSDKGITGNAISGSVTQISDDAKPSEDAEPVENAQPSDDTEPVEGAEPSEDTEPVEDAESSDDTEPVEDTELSDNAEPVEDVQPSDDTESAEDAQPSDDTEPIEDTEPSEDTEPVESVEVSEDTEPADEAAPSEDTEPTEDAQASDNTEPVKGTEPSDVAEPIEDDKPSEPSEDTEPVEDDALSDDIQSDEDAEPFDDTEPAEDAADFSQD